MIKRLQHDFVGNLKEKIRTLPVLHQATHNKILLHGLLKHLGGEVAGDLSDVHVLGKSRSPRQVILVNEFYQSLEGFAMFSKCQFSTWLPTSAALLIMALVTTPVWPSAAPRARPGKMYLRGVRIMVNIQHHSGEKVNLCDMNLCQGMH